MLNLEGIFKPTGVTIIGCTEKEKIILHLCHSSKKLDKKDTMIYSNICHNCIKIINTVVTDITVNEQKGGVLF